MLLLIIMSSALASAQAQRSGGTSGFTLTSKSISFSDLFTQLRKQTGKIVWYGQEFDQNKKVTVKFLNASLQEVMETLFSKTDIQWKIEDEAILLTTKKKSDNSNVADPKANNVRVDAASDTTEKLVDISGKVTDEKGSPIPGATIIIKGTTSGTTSNNSGDFSLKDVPVKGKITISSISFVTKDVTVGSKRNLGNIQLKNYVGQLDETVILAYSKTTNRFLTGNVSKVTAKEMENSPVNNPILAAVGRIPGIEITQSTGFSGGGVNIVVQGLNSLQKGSAPFYVIDGVPYAQSLLPNIGNTLGLSGNGAGNGPVTGSPLSYINPADIESIEVLKDADATAIYGSRAANGAIIITTKRGKSGKMKVDVTYQTGFGQVAHKLDLLNTKEYLEMRREAFANDNQTVGSTDYDLNGTWDTTKNTNWQKELIGKNAKYRDLQMGISGGSDNVQYLFGSSIHKESTVFSTNLADEKVAFRFNLDALSNNKKLRFTLSSSYLIDNNKLPTSDLTSAAVTLAPNTPNLKNPDGSINWGNNNAQNISTIFPNPLAGLSSLYLNKAKNLISNAIISYEVLNGLELKSSFGYTDLSTNEIVTYPQSARPPEYRKYNTPSANYNNNDIKSWIIEPQISYNNKLASGNINAVVGATLQQNNSSREYLLGSGYSSDLVLENINAAKTITSFPGTAILSTYKYNAAFFQVNYNWLDKYVINLTGRRDGSSRFGSQNRFHNFGAVGAAWIFSSENWFKHKQAILSYGKLKASYGSTGNDQIGDYNYLSLYQNNNPDVPYNGSTSLAINTLSNPYLQWEETKKRSVGLDLGFIHDRILLNINYYKNTSSNMLVVAPLPATSGPIAGLVANLPATITNTGIELSLTTINYKANDFTWTTNLNLTVPKNEVSKFENLNSSIYANAYVIGQSSSVVRAYRTNGVNKTTGIYQFLDKDNKVTNDPGSDPANYSRLINPNPQYYGGLNNTITYKNFNISFLLQYFKHLGKNTQNSDPPGFTKMNQQRSVLDRWQKEGDNKPVQRYAASDFDYYFSFYNQYLSDAYWTDASYLRLKNVSISYNLPARWLSSLKMNMCRVFINGQNLLTITPYKGLDPETLSNASLPPLRVFTFGIQASL
ncbi:SusC/RagA family TonB-linked outer membrane protein [Chitinophaga sp. YR573]|uniref:SusC/RagA family TonB-linked outer membrane protein n=1 Tax=Chitinophaga sp. YR573 TaxID=1881040 RepID=UPI0015A54EF3|nr:SusC/RagA family TonB-linked outer membrane protein [Chitinophaga sp. YR573]